MAKVRMRNKSNGDIKHFDESALTNADIINNWTMEDVRMFNTKTNEVRFFPQAYANSNRAKLVGWIVQDVNQQSAKTETEPASEAAEIRAEESAPETKEESPKKKTPAKRKRKTSK